MTLTPRAALCIWRRALTHSLADEGPDLTGRQMAILLSVYFSADAATVRGLAAELDISKSAVTRGLDRLERLGFVRRRKDDADRRSVIVEHTARGSTYLGDFGGIVARAARDT